MKYKKMRISSVFGVMLLSTLVRTAGAQVIKQNSPSAPQMMVIDPSASIEKLRSVVGNVGDMKSGPNETGHQFGLDINKIKTAMPGLIRTETIWYSKGKNNQTGSNKEIIDYGQLVPLLIGALQEQIGQYEALKKEVEVLKLQLRSKGEAAEAISVNADNKSDVDAIACSATF
jgi:hypothetical protein